jgi:uridine kinase
MPILIGVAGGSASGKSTVVERLADRLGRDTVAVIEHDRYYKKLPGLSHDERESVNYDHPDALETELLVQHLDALRQGVAVDLPIYDFRRHVRLPQSDRIDPRPIIFVEGLLVLADARVRDALDLRVFVDTAEHARYERRLKRDVAERGRSEASVQQQFAESVRPMHVRFVEPSRRYADVIVADGGFNEVAVGMVLTQILAAGGTRSV